MQKLYKSSTQRKAFSLVISLTTNNFDELAQTYLFFFEQTIKML